MKRYSVIVLGLLALASVLTFRQGNNDMPGLSPLAAEFSNTGIVDFGYLPKLANINQRSFSVWVYPTTADVGSIIGLMDGNDAGSRIIITGSRTIWYIKAVHPTGFPTVVQSNIWETTETISLNAWHLVTVTQDVTSTPATDPVIYLDAAVATLTNPSPVAGTNVDETSDPLQIGNMQTVNTESTLPFLGKILDARMYNVILTQANVTAIYNSGTPSMSAGTKTGLIFQPFAVRTEKLSSYTNQNINGLKLFDAQFLAVGTVTGDVTGRAAP